MPDAIRLNLGAGDCPLPGFINLDRKDGQEIYPLSVADSSVDEIRASHVLEHFPYGQVEAVVRDWVRALRPGGILRLAVPDFEWIARSYLEGHPFNVQGMTMGGQVDADDYHRAIFDKEVLTELLHDVGLVDVRHWESETTDCAALPVSLNLQARKPAPRPDLKIKAAMSVPRLGFQDNFFCWAQALMPLGIVPTKYDGAFWGQCIERVMEAMVDECDWILTLDYDSVFDRSTVERLIDIAATSDADAVAALQIKRGGGTPLMTMRDEAGEMRGQVPADEFRADLVKVHTAHFGLTMIRSESLKKLPHPWFRGVPGPSGKWDDERIDDDIYFWNRWAEHGLTACVAPRVVIGHAELMVSWPGKQFQVLYQHPSEFWKSGMPKGVWT